MPFYIRKSVSAGPFRFNFSKGGIGASVGIKGLRLGTGPRGHYIHAGRGGLYYRASLGRAGGRTRPAAPSKPPSQVTFEHSDVSMIEIDSGDVMQMRDESLGSLLDEVNAKAGQVRASVALCWTAIALGMVAGLASGGSGLVICILALPSWAVGKWFDSYRRSAVLYYELEGDAEVAYKQLTDGFDGLSKCEGKWHIEAGGAIQSLTAWKQNAGASHLVDRKATTLAYGLPTFIKSNLTPPALRVGKQVMFFMPDVVFVQNGSRIGAVNYFDLRIRWQDSRFIETERVPNDASVVGHTWKHPNKSGGPDRRFNDNRQIPICLYEAVHFQSDNGVNELVEFSRTGVAAAFAEGCQMLGRLPRERATALPSRATNEGPQSTPAIGPVRKRRPLRTAALIALGLFAGLPIIGAMLKSERTNSTTGPTLVTDPNLSAAVSEPSSRKRLVSAPSTDRQPEPLATLASTPAAIEASSEVQQAPIERNANAIEMAPLSIELVDTERESAKFAPASPATETIKYTQTAVNLREGPGTKYPVKAVIQRDVAVSVLETRGTWSFVRIEQTAVGWMANSTISSSRPQ